MSSSSATFDRDSTFVSGDDRTEKEALPAYENVPTAPPTYVSRPPTIHEPRQEWRWTGGPDPEAGRGRPRRFVNNPHAAELYAAQYLGSRRSQTDAEHDTSEPSSSEKYSRSALIELIVRLVSWTAALGAFSSAIHLCVHVKSLRTSAGAGQLAVSVRGLRPSVVWGWLAKRYAGAVCARSRLVQDILLGICQ